MSKGLEALKRVEIQYNELGIKHNESDCHINEEDYFTIKDELKEREDYKEILNSYGLTLVDFREACLLFAMLKGDKRNIRNINKQHDMLEILKAFEFEIEDYTEDKHGAITVKYKRIIVDDDEIDIAKEVLK